jgi:hypothetical protein
MGIALLLGSFSISSDLVSRFPALLYRVALGQVAKNDQIPQVGRALVADLDAMELRLMENGEEISRIDILSRGRPGTPWETPAGNYVVKTKETEHFSSLGGVWMPWSMQFYGNYFIHGWPTHADGTEVSPGYSGGCIRLATPDAKRVYNFASLGTPLIIHGRGAATVATSSAKERYYLRGQGPLPKLASRSFVVADLHTGAVLWEKNAQERLPLGASSLLMTGITALETVNQYKTVRMSELLLGKAIPRKKTGGPDELPLGALIYPLMFNVNETAAQAFANEHGPRAFVSAMNEKARALGMEHTVFDDPGVSDDNQGTARDMFVLLRGVYEQKHFLLDASLASKKTLDDASGRERFRWENRNPWVLSGDTSFLGGIVASTSSQAPGVFIGVFSLPLGEFADRDIGIVLLSDGDAESDIVRLREFLPEHFSWGPEVEGEIIREPEESFADIVRKLFPLSFLKGKLYDTYDTAAIGNVVSS